MYSHKHPYTHTHVHTQTHTHTHSLTHLLPCSYYVIPCCGLLPVSYATAVDSALCAAALEDEGRKSQSPSQGWGWLSWRSCGGVPPAWGAAWVPCPGPAVWWNSPASPGERSYWSHSHSRAGLQWEWQWIKSGGLHQPHKDLYHLICYYSQQI